ncbi:MAG: hypothetical protein CW691_07420 [Candidatus Bathyarchaeum sp.]|nr:MAG: hypothetical protein CW691_07420 [Candidatus Bathyarchaeum sp.]
MSLGLPVVALVFGSVTPPQGDVLDLSVHLGCTNEVSSFSCCLQNFDKKYTETYPISVGDNGSLSIGRGANCPLIASIRVEEVTCESSAAENYIRVKGRCWGEKLFRQVVTKRYENQKGEDIVKDLVNYYAGLSHVRDSTELIEDTDTTYTLLEYEDTPVFDILQYVGSSADKNGVIGFDFRVEPDAKFAFFPKNSKTSSVSLSDLIESSEYTKDIQRIRNRVMIHGAQERPCPLDVDGQQWSDTVTEDLTQVSYWLEHALGKWEPITGNTTMSIETSNTLEGSNCVKANCTAYMYYVSFWWVLPGNYVNANKYPALVFAIKADSSHKLNHTIELHDGTGDDNVVWRGFTISETGEWQIIKLEIGKNHADEWTESSFNPSDFRWDLIRGVRFAVNQNSGQYGNVWVDRFYFGNGRWTARRPLEAEEPTSSQTAYGVRELVEVDEELHSNNECDLRAKALLAHLENPAESVTVRSTVLDYGTNALLPADKIHVTLPNENINADYRIVSVEYRVNAATQTLEVVLELGKQTPLLADHLYALRSKNSSLSRYKRGQ